MFGLSEQASPISEGVTEIRISIHIIREITRQHVVTKATQVAIFCDDY
jgi:hypothetical protein